MNVGRVDVNKLRGLGDKFVGLGKEVVGTLIGNDKLEAEGEAQQERASAELRSLRSEAKAQAAEARADTLDAEQRAAQAAKEESAPPPPPPPPPPVV